MNVEVLGLVVLGITVSRSNKKGGALARPPPRRSLGITRIARDHVAEVVETAGRGTEATEQGIRESQERTVLVDPTEIVDGMAGDEVTKRPGASGPVARR